MKKMALSGMLLLVAALAVVLGLEGCTSQVAGPKSQATPGERLSVSKEKAAVLLRMKGSIENKLFEEVPIMSGPEDKGFGVFLKPQGGLAIPILVQLHRIDAAEVGQKGWLYFFIDPGDYELEFGQNQGKGQKPLSPSFILRVPPQRSIVYAGSVHFDCGMKGGFWGPTLGECQNIRVTDEGKTAQNMADRLFDESGQVFTSILAKAGKRTLPASYQYWYFPMGLIVAGSNNMVTPDWTKRGIARATGIGEVPGDQIAKGILDWQWIGIAYLLYMPVGATIGAVSGKAAESKWRPCLEGLRKEIAKIEPAAMLRGKLIQELTKYGGSQPVALPPGDFSREAARHGLKTLLQAEIQRIQLRECQERGSFCIELALRARLWEAKKHNLLQEKVLLYSNLHPYRTYSEARPYEVAAPASSPCRHMEVYCSPEGSQVFRQEIAAGLDSLVEKLCFELGLLSK